MPSENKENKESKKMSIGLSIIAAGFLIALAIFYASGNKQANIKQTIQTDDQEQEKEIENLETLIPEKQEPEIYKTFSYYPENEICRQDGKPVIRLFSTTWCPHCEWIKPVFYSVAQEYKEAGKIIAYNWEIDINDNALTTETETQVPASEISVYQEFNPGGSIPTFVFGCKYFRIGNGYERQEDLQAEEAEFREIIELLLNE